MCTQMTGEFKKEFKDKLNYWDIDKVVSRVLEGMLTW